MKKVESYSIPFVSIFSPRRKTLSEFIVLLGNSNEIVDYLLHCNL